MADAMAMRMDAAGVLLQAPSLDAVSTQAWSRLLKACALSFLLHIALLVGIPVNPTGGVPQVVSTITARLEPAAEEPAPESPALLQETALAPAPLADHPPKPAEPKTETRPEPARAKEPAASPSSGLELPFIRDPTYYMPNQLDVIPSLLAEVDRTCPDAAKAQRINGQARLLLLIDEFGVVNEASITQASPPGFFEEVTLARFRAARFMPGQKQGHAVKSRVQLMMKYPCDAGDVAAR